MCPALQLCGVYKLESTVLQVALDVAITTNGFQIVFARTCYYSVAYIVSL